MDAVNEGVQQEVWLSFSETAQLSQNQRFPDVFFPVIDPEESLSQL